MIAKLIKITRSNKILLILVCILTLPSFVSLVNNFYFPMHDDQHIARLFLLNEAINQGNHYPRWVGLLGFNFGYPLFNFYPPLIYYISELFHQIGFSLIVSIKLLIAFGYIASAIAMYFLTCELVKNRLASTVAAVLYTYFGYHAVLVYVRGALAEFFSLVLLPLIFLNIHLLYKKMTLRNTLFFALCLALLIITHPLIALPGLIYVFFLYLFYFLKTKEKKLFTKFVALGVTVAFSLSAFFWLPSIFERSSTLVDQILLTELADYKLHFVYPQQLWYSPWGFGGSISGPNDGMSFALGKIYILLVLVSMILAVSPLIINRIKSPYIKQFIKLKKTIELGEIKKIYYYYLLLLLISLFMTTSWSGPIWQKLHFLAYLQFPWRFLTFVAVFISVVGAFNIVFAEKLFDSINSKYRLHKNFGRISKLMLFTLLVGVPIFVNNKYFKPKSYYFTTDAQKTSFDEIAWKVSRSSFEFSPKDVKTVKSELNTTIIDINQNKINELKKKSFEIVKGQANVIETENLYMKKKFDILADSIVTFRLLSFNFPGWKAAVNGLNLPINDNNDYKLITVEVPRGKGKLEFTFVDTPVRFFSEALSLATIILTLGYLTTPLLSKISDDFKI